MGLQSITNCKKMHHDKDMIVKMYTGYLENGILGIDYEILAYLE